MLTSISQLNWTHIANVGTSIIAICSAAHTFLPPWDWRPDFVEVGMAEFPTAQKIFYGIFHNRYYRLLIYVVGFVALNGRSTIWKFISVNNPVGPNATVPTVIHAANQQLNAAEAGK